MRQRGISRIYLYPGIFIAAVVLLAVLRIVALNWQDRPPADPGPAVPVVATQPASPTSTQPAAEPDRPLVDLLGVLRADEPDYPTVEPLELPSDLADAARIVIKRPVYLDPRGNLWITHPRGQSLHELLRRPIRQQTLVVDEEVVFAWWQPNGKPLVIVRESPNGYAFRGGRLDKWLMTGVDIHRALPLGERLVAPLSKGLGLMTLLDPGPEGTKAERVADPDQAQTPSIAAIANEGLVVWAPWEAGMPGSRGAIFYDATGRQTRLDAAAGWVDRPIQMVPLADGHVLAVGRTETGIELALKPLTAAPPLSPEQLAAVTTLARKLADRDPQVREATQRELEAMGPTIYPELEKMLDRLPAEAQVRIETILGQRFAPTLAGLRPLEGEVRTVARFPDGGCVLLLTGGGAYEEDGQDKTQIPAFVSIRPGRYLERIDPSSVVNFVPGRHRIGAFGNEWVIVDPNEGAQRWIGNKLYPLAGPEHKAFDEFVGIDAQRRWIFRSSTLPGQTLILDTSLPDLEPRLPVWAIDAPDGAGWTSADWPAMKRGDKVFVLGERGWRMLEKGETFTATPLNVLATSATTPGGDRFEWVGGEIAVTAKDGSRTSATLPAEADEVQLFWTADRLFAVSASSIHRYAWREGTLRLEKSFSDKLPSGELARVWLDPAGRLCLAQPTGVWITFPTGRVPGPISQLMLGGR